MPRLARLILRDIDPILIVAFVRFAVVSCHLEQTALFWWQRREIDSMGKAESQIWLHVLKLLESTNSY